MRRSKLVLACASLALLATACSGSSSGSTEPVPDFELLDVNPTSTTYDTPVSPRDYITYVSGYYFGSAT